jgi:hypothetical protein
MDARMSLRCAVVLLLLATSSCATGSVGSAVAKPPDYNPEGGQAKCGVIKSQARPLIVEWPSADRATLEALVRRGVVVVRYEGCEMQVLPQCTVKGDYGFTATTRKRDEVTIENSDELYAKLPLGAAKLEGELARSGSLNVGMSIVGEYRSSSLSVTADQLPKGCDKATHVVSAYTVGAFRFYAGAKGKVSGGASGLGAEAKAGSKSESKLLKEDGNEDACTKATTKDEAPPGDCSAILRLEVTEIGRAAKPAASLAGDEDESDARIAFRLHCGANDEYLTPHIGGLKVTLDGGPVRMGARSTVIETSPGDHSLHIESAGCLPHDINVNVEPGTTVPITGRLQDTFKERFNRSEGPASPEGFQISAGYWSAFGSRTSTMDAEGGGSAINGKPLEITFNSAPRTNGFLAQAGVIFARYLFASAQLGYGTTGKVAVGTDTASLSMYTLAGLAGVRVPLVYGAVSLGSGLRITPTTVTLDSGITLKTTATTAPIWLALEAKPVCNFGLVLGGGPEIALSKPDAGSAFTFFSLGLQLLYHPNNDCNPEFGIVEGKPEPIPKKPKSSPKPTESSPPTPAPAAPAAAPTSSWWCAGMYCNKSAASCAARAGGQVCTQAADAICMYTPGTSAPFDCYRTIESCNIVKSTSPNQCTSRKVTEVAECAACQ